ncbi:4-hydroxybenzoate polyprenyl transferase [Botrytis cinerea]
MSRNGVFSLPGGCRNAFFQNISWSQRPSLKIPTGYSKITTSTSSYFSRKEARKNFEARHERYHSIRAHAIPTALNNTKIPNIDNATPSPIITPYVPPTTGLLSKLPSSWVPYAELIRLDKPAGTYYLFFPCLFSTLLAAPLTAPIVSPLTVVGTSLLFFSGALIMRGAGCTINDLWIEILTLMLLGLDYALSREELSLHSKL